MKQEVANQVNLWENLFEEHAEKQQHNPFSEWSSEHPKKPYTSPSKEYSGPPYIHSQRGPSPFGEQPNISNSQQYNPFGAQSPRPFSQFNPSEQYLKTSPLKYSYLQEEQSPKTIPENHFYPQDEFPLTIIQPKYFFPPGEPSPTISPPKNFYPSGEPSSESIHPKYFYRAGEPNPRTIHPKTFYPSGEPNSKPIHPKYFYPPELTQPAIYPQTYHLSEEPSPKTIHPKYFYPQEEPSQNAISPKTFHPSGEPSSRIYNPKALDPSKGQNPQVFNPPNSSKSDETVGFLSQVKKWRKPGSEVKDLVPLTKIPEPAQPAEPIKVKTTTPWEDPLTGQTFSPQEPSWAGRSEQESEVERQEFLKWKSLPKTEYFKFSPANQAKPNEVSKVLPGWTPMGQTFADVVGGEQTISLNFHERNRPHDTRVEYEYPDSTGNWDHSVSITQSYANPLQQIDDSDIMNYKYKNMSSQINMWQQRVKEHEQKQLINPFSEWDGAPDPTKRSTIGIRLGRLGTISKTDPEYGRPVEGSMTDIRGKKAGVHISNEITELCQIITDLGKRQPDNSVVIKFGALFQAYTRISNKLVGMLMRARKQDLVHFEGEMLFQGRDDDVVIKLLKAVERQTTESVVGIESESGDAARSSGGAPADIKIPASAEEASATGASTEEMLSKRESANMMKRGTSLSSSSMMNKESCMSMQEESLGSSKMMTSSSNSAHMMSKEDSEFSTKMFAGSSNATNMMSKEESSSSTKMMSESSSSMKMLKEEGSLSTHMLGEGVGDSAKMLAGVSISPAVTQDALMDSLKAGEIFNSMKMVPSEGNTSQLLSKNGLGTVSNMASSEMMSKQQASSSSSMLSKQISSTSEQMSTASEQMSTAMENMSMCSADSKQSKMLSSQMSSASEQMSSASEQMSMSSEQMSMSSKQMSSSSQMKQVSDISHVSSDMMSTLLDDPFGKMVGTLGTTTSGLTQKSSQQSSSSQLLSKKFSSFESSSDTALLDETHSLLSSDLQDFKKLT